MLVLGNHSKHVNIWVCNGPVYNLIWNGWCPYINICF